MKKNIAVHLADGFEEIEAISIVDMLRRADLKVLLISINGTLEVTGAHQLKVIADCLFEEVDYDMVEMIILPGGMPGATNLNNHIGLKLQIEKFAKENRYLAAICAAPLVYGNLGILNGKQAVCYPGFESYLKGAQILNLPVVEYQNLITSKGPGSVFEFALKIIEKLVSKEKAALVASQMLLR